MIDAILAFLGALVILYLAIKLGEKWGEVSREQHEEILSEIKKCQK